MNSGIQALRAVAALLVLVQHVIYYACTQTGADFLPFLPLPFGSIGVTIFFVLSGYLMAQCIGHGLSFFPRRALRIYPAYWIAIALSALVVPALGREWTIDPVSVLLIPTTTLNQSYTIPYWTLVYEMAFYAVFAIGILLRLSPAVFTRALMVWGLAIIGSSVVGLTPPDPVVVAAPGAWILLSPSTLLFVIGAIAGLAGREHLAAAPGTTLAVGAAGFFAITMISPWSLAADYLLLGAAIVLLIELVRRWAPPRWLATVGDWSYGLYLVHVLGIAVALQLLEAVAPDARLLIVGAVALVGGAGLGLAFGLLDHVLYRRALKPAFDAMLRRMRRSRSPRESRIDATQE